MAKKRKRKSTKKRILLPARRNLSDLGALKMGGIDFEPSLYGAAAGIGAAFLDNMVNIEPKIKGAILIGASAFIPAPDSVKGAIAGKGGEVLAKSFGILSDELDGFIAVSEDEISELADELSEELQDKEVINDTDVINSLVDGLNEDVQI